MTGEGCVFIKASSADAFFTFAQEVNVTNGQGMATTRNQANGQVMYSYRF